jgi:hypothetical protein
MRLDRVIAPIARKTVSKQYVDGRFTGHLSQALFGTLTPDVMALTVAYSLAGLGIAIVNDFKSIEGDRCGGQSQVC